MIITLFHRCSSNRTHSSFMRTGILFLTLSAFGALSFSTTLCRAAVTAPPSSSTSARPPSSSTASSSSPLSSSSSSSSPLSPSSATRRSGRDIHEVPWGEIFSALQDSNLGAEDMRDLQVYMQDTIKAQQAAQAEEEGRKRRRRRRRRLDAGETTAAVGVEGAEGAGTEESLATPVTTASAGEGEDSEGEEMDDAPSPRTTFEWKSTIAAFKEQTKIIERSISLRKDGNEKLAAGDIEGAYSQYEEALMVLEKGTVVQTGRTRRCAQSCQLNMAVVETKRSDYAKALGMYSTVLAGLESGSEGGKGDDKAVRWQCLTKRARIARRMGRMEEAFKDLVQANQLKPNDQKVAAELEEMGGTPVTPPPQAFCSSFLPSAAGGESPLDALLGGEGGGGADILGGLLGSLGSGAGGLGGAGGEGDILGGLMGNYLSSMGSRMVDMLEQPETLTMVCTLLKKLQPDYLESLAVTANLPVSKGTIRWIHEKATGLEPRDIKRWVSRGKWAHSSYVSTKRTWESVKPLVRPTRLVMTYCLVLRWMAACLLG